MHPGYRPVFAPSLHSPASTHCYRSLTHAWACSVSAADVVVLLISILFCVNFIILGPLTSPVLDPGRTHCHLKYLSMTIWMQIFYGHFLAEVHSILCRSHQLQKTCKDLFKLAANSSFFCWYNDAASPCITRHTSIFNSCHTPLF